MFRESKGILARMLFGEAVEWPNVELPEVRNLRVDMLARCADGSLRQVEFQTKNEAAMGFRMLEYSVALRRAYGQTVRQRVLFAGREPLRMEGVFETEWTRHEFSILNLREMDGDEQERAAFSFSILGGMIGMEQVLERRFQSEMIDLMENKILGPAIRKGLEQGLEQGLKQGRAEGRVEGKAEARLELVRAMLKGRFGALPEWAEKRIEAATPEAQTEYALKLHAVSSLEELLG